MCENFSGRQLTMSHSSATIFTLLMVLCSVYAGDNRRPFYNIGHMVNSIEEIPKYLNMGANVLETDIQFHPNGSVKEAHHDLPCECFRTCTPRANLKDFLEYIKKITDPSEPINFANQMVMQFFDLKLNESHNKRVAGRELAEHVLDYLWTKDGSRKQEVRALVYIDSVEYEDVIQAFIEEFKTREVESRLRDVGFDGGSGNLKNIQDMFTHLGIKGNIWQGDGTWNCDSLLYPDGRLKQAVANRNSPNGFIQKVYHWTIDEELRIKQSLDIGVDGMITNVPDNLLKVLQESRYSDTFRLATPDDDPFAKYQGE